MLQHLVTVSSFLWGGWYHCWYITCICSYVIIILSLREICAWMTASLLKVLTYEMSKIRWLLRSHIGRSMYLPLHAMFAAPIRMCVFFFNHPLQCFRARFLMFYKQAKCTAWNLFDVYNMFFFWQLLCNKWNAHSTRPNCDP